MNKKIMIAICCIVIVILIIVIITNKKKKVSVQNEIKTEDNQVSDIVQDEETGEYVIYDKETGEEIARSFDEATLHIYEIDPDYDPKLPNMEDENLEE